jgi:hypothetical protein
VRWVRGFGRFWYDFIVGDDWRIAAGVCLVLGVGAVLVGIASAPDAVVTLVVLAGILVVAATSIVSAR